MEGTERPFADGIGEEASEGATPLTVAAKLRIPKFDPDVGKAGLVDKLTDFMLESAYVRAEVAELRLAAQRSLKKDADEWRELEGYQVGAGALRTKADHQEAKRKARPDLHQRIEDAKWTVERCAEAIDRLDNDAVTASRSYTLLSGS